MPLASPNQPASTNDNEGMELCLLLLDLLLYPVENTLPLSFPGRGSPLESLIMTAHNICISQVATFWYIKGRHRQGMCICQMLLSCALLPKDKASYFIFPTDEQSHCHGRGTKESSAQLKAQLTDFVNSLYSDSKASDSWTVHFLDY